MGETHQLEVGESKMLVKHRALSSSIDRLKHICIVLMIYLCHSGQTLNLMMATSDIFNISGCCIVVHNFCFRIC